MSFDWRTDDILRKPANAEVEQLATEQDGGGCFRLVVDGEVCAVIQFAEDPPWLAKFLGALSEEGFPRLTVQDWVVILNVAPSAFFAILNALLQCGFLMRPQRRPVRAEPALA